MPVYTCHVEFPRASVHTSDGAFVPPGTAREKPGKPTGPIKVARYFYAEEDRVSGERGASCRASLYILNFENRINHTINSER